MTEFPARIAQFIDQQIESLAQLEALLLLRKQPERGWDLEEIAKTLYLTPEMAAALMVELQRRGWAQAAQAPAVSFSFHSHGKETDALIDELGEIYQERRVAVITQIYSKPLNKVQTFADAFRLRREEPQ
jgi:hypothetical protein